MLGGLTSEALKGSRISVITFFSSCSMKSITWRVRVRMRVRVEG